MKIIVRQLSEEDLSDRNIQCGKNVIIISKYPLVKEYKYNIMSKTIKKVNIK